MSGCIGLLLIGISLYSARYGSGKGADEAAPLFIAFAVFVLLIVTPLVVLHIITGRKVGQARWRLMQSALAALAIIHFPLGTLFGGYALWVCWGNKKTKTRFEGDHPSPN